MPRPILLSAAVILVLLACRDDRIPTAPETAAPAIAPVLTESVVAASSGVSSICLVNRRALADLDGQLQDNPDNASLQAAHAAQSAITADVCD